MASKVLLIFLLVCVGVCHGQTNRSKDDLKNVCTGDCPEYELLCSTPEYDVRRLKSALWVSTTVSDLSLSQASGRGRKRLHDYFGGANDERRKMSHTAPMVTQTREPSDSPLREITVSMPLPKNMPKPTDPRVVIDLVPETIMYVKKFQGRSARVGFVADLEARNFFKTLETNKEPFQGTGDYYYVAQYGSSKDSSKRSNEIWVFAINERTYKWLEFNDLTEHGQGLPTCLRNHTGPMVWEKMDQSDIPLLTREQCSTTYCDAPKKCPKFVTKEVKGVDDKSITLKQLKGVKTSPHVPPTCYYDTAIHASTSPSVESLRATDVPPSETGVMVTVVMEQRKDIEGEKSCQKFFMVLFTGEDEAERSQDTEFGMKLDGVQMPKTVKALHRGQATAGETTYYSKCFGGNAYYEPGTVTATAKVLMDRLREKKKCFLGDHISITEFHPQSRLFDRHNEINVDVDIDCSDQEGRPPFTFHLPLSRSYSRAEVRPSLGDQCVTNECPNRTTVMKLDNNMQMIQYEPATWFYSKSPSPSCTNGEAFYKALDLLLSYMNGKNEDSSNIDMTRPLYAKVNFEEPECGKTVNVSTVVPGKFADSPPTPIAENVYFNRYTVGGRFFRSLFKTKGGTAAAGQRLNQILEDLDQLKPFGLEYNVDDIWLGAYDDLDKEERLFEFVLALKKPPQESSEDAYDEAETGGNATEAIEGRLALPKPEGCNEQTCPTVYVTKNHSNYMELEVPPRKAVCHKVKLCRPPETSGRQLLIPLIKYFEGDNSENNAISDTGFRAIQTKVYSEEEEKAIGPCEREYRACAVLAEEYQDKELPKPNRKEMAILPMEDPYHAYGISMKGRNSWNISTEGTRALVKVLDEANVEYSKTWVRAFSYDQPFTDSKEKITYFFVVKDEGGQAEDT